MSSLLFFGRAGMAVISIAMLAACSTTGRTVVEQACPLTQIAAPSDRIGNSDANGTIRYVATIEQLVSSCRIDENHVAVNLAFDVKAERGPAFEDRPVSLTYYIATVDPNREIIDKKILRVELELKPAEVQSVLREELTLHLPISTDATGANYNLYLGFQP